MPASRTPEGFPSRCPLCHAAVFVDYSSVGHDAPCPCCGVLLRQADQITANVVDTLAGVLGVSPGVLTADTALAKLRIGSLDAVELVMQLEETLEGFNLDIPADALENCQTIADLVRAVLRHNRS